jgi:hypothetical protein
VPGSNLEQIEDALRNVQDPNLQKIFVHGQGQPSRLFRAIEPAGGTIAAKPVLEAGGMLSPAGVRAAQTTLEGGADAARAFQQGVQSADDALRDIARLANDPDALARRLADLAGQHLPGTHDEFLRWIANAPPEARTFISAFTQQRAAVSRAAKVGGIATEIPVGGRILIAVAELPEIAADIARLEVVAATKYGFRLPRIAGESAGQYGLRLLRNLEGRFPRGRSGYREIPWDVWQSWGLTRSQGAFVNQMNEFLLLGAQSGGRVL